jgi:hypothetical protein
MHALGCAVSLSLSLELPVTRFFAQTYSSGVYGELKGLSVVLPAGTF